MLRGTFCKVFLLHFQYVGMIMPLVHATAGGSGSGGVTDFEKSLAFLGSSHSVPFVEKLIIVLMASRGAAAALNWGKKAGARAGNGGKNKTTSIPGHILSAVVLGIVGNCAFFLS